jgi:hypothetical protein
MARQPCDSNIASHWSGGENFQRHSLLRCLETFGMPAHTADGRRVELVCQARRPARSGQNSTPAPTNITLLHIALPVARPQAPEIHHHATRTADTSETLPTTHRPYLRRKALWAAVLPRVFTSARHERAMGGRGLPALRWCVVPQRAVLLCGGDLSYGAVSSRLPMRSLGAAWQAFLSHVLPCRASFH